LFPRGQLVMRATYGRPVAASYFTIACAISRTSIAPSIGFSVAQGLPCGDQSIHGLIQFPGAVAVRGDVFDDFHGPDFIGSFPASKLEGRG
jgi:phenolic acid decarboxylase